MKEIQLSQGKVALVDDEDFEWLNQWKWHYSNGYAVRPGWVNKKNYTVRMHREIMKTPYGMDTDHINENRLDNRRCNLRICTRAQNVNNQGARSNNTSGFKGVFANGNQWTSRIAVDGKLIRLGSYKTREEAARAYDEAAKKYHKEFAHLNFK